MMLPTYNFTYFQYWCSLLPPSIPKLRNRKAGTNCFYPLSFVITSIFISRFNKFTQRICCDTVFVGNGCQLFSIFLRLKCFVPLFYLLFRLTVHFVETIDIFPNIVSFINQVGARCHKTDQLLFGYSLFAVSAICVAGDQSHYIIVVDDS